MSSFVVEETVSLARHSAKQVRYLPTQLEKAMEISLTNTQLCRNQSQEKANRNYMSVYWLIVQLVERLTVNQEVAGSSPAESAKSYHPTY